MRGDWLREGQHITAIGADDPTKWELDAKALKRARVFVDSIASTAANGDVHRAIEKGEYALDELSGEIGELLSGQKGWSQGQLRHHDCKVCRHRRARPGCCREGL